LKDFEPQKADALQSGAAPGVATRRSAAHLEKHLASPMTKASEAALAAHCEPEVLKAASLSHPANAAPLDDLLTQLQQSYGNVHVQRVVAEMSGASHDREAETGSSLDPGIRSEMESAYGEDFSGVRVHTDDFAEAAAESLEARAFTRGQDIYFNRGVYSPGTPAGKETLAHELAHVAQQRGSSANPGASLIDQGSDVFEREADQAAATVAAGGRVRVAKHGATPAVQRQKKEEAQKKAEPPKIEAPKIAYHSDEIGPYPATGTVNASGQFAFAYGYNIGKDADFVPLTLSVPSGVGVNVVPLTAMSESDYSLTNTGGADARAIVISASYHLKRAPAFQVALTKGNFTYVVVFRFPTGAAAKPGKPGKS